MSVSNINDKNPIVSLSPYAIDEKKAKTLRDKKCLRYQNVFNLFLTHLNTLFKVTDNVYSSHQLQPLIGCTTNNDIIHSIAGLFDICLPDMDLDTIYNTIADQEAYTVVVCCPLDATIKRVNDNLRKIQNKQVKIDKIEQIWKKKFLKKELNEEENEEDVYCAEETEEDGFKVIFDREDEKEPVESSEDEDEVENYSRGYCKFMRAACARRIRLLGSEEPTEDVGFERQVAGAISFKLRHVDVRRIVHVTMLGVLEEFRALGLGGYLLRLALDENIVGRYEAVVVHADYSAADFFKKYGFSDDVLINTQWHELEPEYTNCSLLTFVPAYSRGRSDDKHRQEFSAAEIEVDLRLWQRRAVELHSFQFQTFRRMRMEVDHLKSVIKNQDDIMKGLMKELRDCTKEKLRLEKFIKSTSHLRTGCGEKDAVLNNNLMVDLLSPRLDDEFISRPADEAKIKTNFQEMLKTFNQEQMLQFISFIPSKPPPILCVEFKAMKKSFEVFSTGSKSRSLAYSRILYFCQSFSVTADDKHQILTEGFAKRHRKSGSHGNGFYFSSSPLTAAVYAKDNLVIVAEVILGNIHKPTDQVKLQCETPPDGYNSILVTASTSNSSSENISMNDKCLSEEFVVFNRSQALPLGLVTCKMIDL